MIEDFEEQAMADFDRTLDRDLYRSELTVPELSELEEHLGPRQSWINRCHEISLRALRTGLFGKPGPRLRVVRGITSGYGIGGQHSWIACGVPYEPDCLYIDVTAQAWGKVEGIVVTDAQEAYVAFLEQTHGERQGHAIHGYNPDSIWDYGHPSKGHPPHFALDPTGLSEEAQHFAHLLGPLSVEAWASLFRYPKGGWPYRQILTAVAKQIPRIDVLVNIDTLSMVTDDGMEGIYW